MTRVGFLSHSSSALWRRSAGSSVSCGSTGAASSSASGYDPVHTATHPQFPSDVLPSGPGQHRAEPHGTRRTGRASIPRVNRPPANDATDRGQAPRAHSGAAHRGWARRPALADADTCPLAGTGATWLTVSADRTMPHLPRSGGRCGVLRSRAASGDLCPLRAMRDAMAERGTAVMACAVALTDSAVPSPDRSGTVA